MKPIRTMLAEDEPRLASLLGDLLDAEPGIELVGVATNAGDAVEICRRERPQVALLDVRMPGGGGPRAAREVARLERPPRVIAYSATDTRAAVIEMLRAGAVGYLVKGCPLDEIVEGIHRAAHDEAVLSPRLGAEVIDALMDELQRRDGAGDGAEAHRQIRETIAARRFDTVFQPIFALASREIVGYEALTRFTGSSRSPDEWFAEAGLVGLGVELESATLGVAVGSLVGGADGRWPAFLSVNASPSAIQSAEFMSTLCDGFEGPLVVEITEHARIEEYDAFRAAFEPLRERGVKLAVDDAGAGYASLRHILQLQPDLIKLDNSLTRGLDHDRARRAIAAGLISFAREADAAVVAEGIETHEELETLAELGADYGQGYHLGRPAPALGGIWQSASS